MGKMKFFIVIVIHLYQTWLCCVISRRTINFLLFLGWEGRRHCGSETGAVFWGWEERHYFESLRTSWVITSKSDDLGCARRRPKATRIRLIALDNTDLTSATLTFHLVLAKFFLMFWLTWLWMSLLLAASPAILRNTIRSERHSPKIDAQRQENEIYFRSPKSRSVVAS